MKPFWIFDFGFSIERPRSKKVLSLAPCALLLALGAMLFALCLPAGAQVRGTAPRIGLLRLTAPPQARFKAFHDALLKLGYVEGQNIVLDYRYAEGKPSLLPKLAVDLVTLKADVIFAMGPPALYAAANATKAIPIVMLASVDPVAAGMIASLARPGGNLTGLSVHSPELIGKQLELLKEAVPSITRVAVLWNPATHGTTLKELQIAASSLGLQLQPVQFRGPKDFESAFRASTKGHAEALLTLPVGMVQSRWKSLADFAIKNRLPLMSGAAAVEAGALMYYGVSYPAIFRRAANYVDRILKGANPAVLPVERPRDFELIINLKTGAEIGVTIPPNMLVRAEKVIR